MNSDIPSRSSYENSVSIEPVVATSQPVVEVVGATKPERVSPEMAHAVGYRAMDVNDPNAFRMQLVFKDLSLDNEQTQQTLATQQGLDALMQSS